GFGGNYGFLPPSSAVPGGSGAGAAIKGPPPKVTDFAKQMQTKPGELSKNRGNLEDRRLGELPSDDKWWVDAKTRSVFQEAKEKKDVYDKAREELAFRRIYAVQTGNLGVNLSVHNNNLRSQSRLTLTALRQVAGRNCLEIGGVWIDENFHAQMPTLTVKAMSDAYFRLLERQPQLKEVFQLGNHLVWVAPNGTALVVDTNDGKDRLADDEIDKL